MRAVLLSLSLLLVPMWASGDPCPVIARMPVDLGRDEALHQQSRFELRQCFGEHIFVDAFEQNQNSPTLTFDTGDSYPRYLVHVLHVLVIQSMGGASDHVYVFSFERGKPALRLRIATKGLVQVRQTDTEVVVKIPTTLYPSSDAKRKSDSVPVQTYRFAVKR